MEARAARRQERAFAPGPSPALACRKSPHFRGPRPKSARPYQGQRERDRHPSPRPVFLPPRAASLRVGPPPNINWQDKPASPYLAPSLQGISFSSGRYSSRHCTPGAINVFALALTVIPGSRAAEPSGHPESGPSGRWRSRSWLSLRPSVGPYAPLCSSGALGQPAPPAPVGTLSARPSAKNPSLRGNLALGRSVPCGVESLPTPRAFGLSFPRKTLSAAALHYVPRPWLLGDSKTGNRSNSIRKENGVPRPADPS